MEDARIGATFKRIHDRIERQANNSLRADGLTLMQVSVLLELSHAEDQQMSMKNLERRLGVAQPTMFGVISRLHQKKLVETLADPRDRRARLAHITPQGLDNVQHAEAHMRNAEETLLRGFSDEERRQLEGYLQRVLRNLE